MSRLRFPTLQDTATRDDDLVLRARRCRRKGETRKLLIALREACLRDENAAWLWAFQGAMLAEAGRTEEALGALRHALWLRHSASDLPRERATQIMIDRVALRSAA
jgi:hypothetical protein